MAEKRGFLQWLLGIEPSHPLLNEQPAEIEPGPPPPVQMPAQPTGQEPSPEDSPCQICGGTSFRWGWLESGLYGTGKGAGQQELPKFTKQKTRFGDFVGLRARLCTRCRHVAIFARQDEDEEPAE